MTLLESSDYRFALLNHRSSDRLGPTLDLFAVQGPGPVFAQRRRSFVERLQRAVSGHAAGCMRRKRNLSGQPPVANLRGKKSRHTSGTARAACGSPPRPAAKATPVG